MLLEKQEDVKALQYILQYVVPHPKPDLAARLISIFGSYREVLAQSHEALEYHGVTPALAHFLSCLDSFLLNAARPLKIGEKVKTFEDIYPFIYRMGLSNTELCLVYFCNDRDVVVDVMLQTARSRNFVNLDRIFDHARYMKKKYAYAIIAHNHPNGMVAPSHADIEVTEDFKKILAMRGADLRDHIISSLGEYYSFWEHGIL